MPMEDGNIFDLFGEAAKNEKRQSAKLKWGSLKNKVKTGEFKILEGEE